MFSDVFEFFLVYCRLERDLYTRTDQFGVEIRERAKWDLREGMVGTPSLRIRERAKWDLRDSMVGTLVLGSGRGPSGT